MTDPVSQAEWNRDSVLLEHRTHKKSILLTCGLSIGEGIFARIIKVRILAKFQVSSHFLPFLITFSMECC